jgi:hypothetical protein
MQAQPKKQRRAGNKTRAQQTNEIAALTNEIRQLASMASKGGGNARPNKVKKQRQRGQAKAPRNGPNALAFRGIPAAVRTVATRRGMSDIRGHRMAWTLGFIYVGNGTNGTTNAVLFQTNTGTYSAGAETHSAVIPIVGGDSQLGKSYINDVQKHFGRKVIKKMWLHLDALVPSTGSAMMIAVAPIRGVGQCSKTIFYPLATAGATANALDSVLSCKDAITCDSFEHKTLDITAYIAGGSGPLQNEFNVSAPYEGTTSPGTTIVISSNDEGDSNFSFLILFRPVSLWVEITLLQPIRAFRCMRWSSSKKLISWTMLADFRIPSTLSRVSFVAISHTSSGLRKRLRGKHR